VAEHGELYRLAVQYRQGPGHPQANRANVGVRRIAKASEHEQKIFVVVRSWTWTSRPITGSYLARAATSESGVVTISSDYRRGASAPQATKHARMRSDPANDRGRHGAPRTSGLQRERSRSVACTHCYAGFW